METSLRVDVGAIIGLQPDSRRASAKPWYASAFLGFADYDYVLFRVLAIADSQRVAMFHLQQSTEKYLKSILLSSGLMFDRRTGHDLVKLIEEVGAKHPLLGDSSMKLFCKRLDPYQTWGHYPEMNLDQTYLTPRWNSGWRNGLGEADLVIATLREVAIAALDAAPYEVSGGSSAWVLEEIVHRDSVLGRHLDEHQNDAEESLRRMLLADNLFFTPAHLPTFEQSFHQHKRYPLIPLPREHPTALTRYGLPMRSANAKLEEG